MALRMFCSGPVVYTPYTAAIGESQLLIVPCLDSWLHVPSCLTKRLCRLDVVRQVMHNSATGEPRYISDGYQLEGFELPVGLPVRLVLRFSPVCRQCSNSVEMAQV